MRAQAESLCQGAVAWVASLERGDMPLERAAAAAARLLRCVAEQPGGSMTELTIASSRRRGLSIAVRPVGVAPPEWMGDLRWAFNGWGRLSTRRRRMIATPARLWEIVPARRQSPRIHELGRFDDDSAQPWSTTGRRPEDLLDTPWPMPLLARLDELLSPSEMGEISLRFQIGGCSTIERQLVAEELQITWMADRDALNDYLGSPVRLRVLVGADRDTLPARARAALRMWGTHLDVIELDAGDIATAWSCDADDLAGRALPFGTALTMVKLPAAGNQPFPGMASSERPYPLRPIDPMPPRPASPVLLGRAKTATGRWTDVTLGMLDLTQHGIIHGASGSGKSRLIASICSSVQAAGGGFTLLDPEGSTIDLLFELSRPEHAARTRLIRHGDRRLDVPLNILRDTDRADLLIDLFAEMIQNAQDPRQEGMVGPRWKRWFGLIAQATCVALGERATLVSVAAIASDAQRINALARAVERRDPALAHRLSHEYGRLDTKESAEMTSWAMSKLGPLLSTADVRWVLGAGPDGLDVAEAMDAGTSLAIDLGSHRLGAPAAKMIGAVHLLKHWDALGRRHNREQLHFIVVDEAHLFSYGALPQLLAEARKFGVGVIIATQHIGQLRGDLADAVESNTGLFIALRSGLESATRASVRLGGWPVDDLTRLPNLTAAAQVNRGGIMTEPFNLVIDQPARARKLERAFGSSAERVRVAEQSSALSASSFRDCQPPDDHELVELLASAAGPTQAPRSFLASGSLDAFMAGSPKSDD